MQRCNYVADGIPKPLIKWRRESQMRELPAFDEDDGDQTLDSNSSSGSSIEVSTEQQQERDSRNHMVNEASSKEAWQRAQQSSVNESHLAKPDINIREEQSQAHSTTSFSQSGT